MAFIIYLFIYLFQEHCWLSTDTFCDKAAVYSNLEASNPRHFCNCWLRNGISYATRTRHFSLRRSIRCRYWAISVPCSVGTSDIIPAVRRLGLEFYFLSTIWLHDLHRDNFVITFVWVFLWSIYQVSRGSLASSINQKSTATLLFDSPQNRNIAH